VAVLGAATIGRTDDEFRVGVTFSATMQNLGMPCVRCNNDGGLIKLVIGTTRIGARNVIGWTVLWDETARRIYLCEGTFGVDALVVTESGAEIEVRTGTETEVGARVRARVGTEVEVGAEAEFEARVRARVETEVEVETEAEVGAETGADAELGARVKARVGTEVEDEVATGTWVW